MDSIAHIRQLDGTIQTIEEHLFGVRDLAKRFGDKIGVGQLAGLAGWLHDTGKYSDEFRDYIIEAVNNPDHPPKKGSVDHSTAGGKILYNKLHLQDTSVAEKLIAEIIGNVIISHHSGLQDFLNPQLESDYLKRVSEKIIEDFQPLTKKFYANITKETELDDYLKECEGEILDYMKENLRGSSGKIQLFFMFLTKYIFSCLIDADRTNTRCFEENDSEIRAAFDPFLFERYYQTLLNHLVELKKRPDSDHPINKLRAKMSEECDRSAENPSGIYTLSIPTGGGKTLASLRYALKHAIRYQKERIIYVVPYTTIIEQNADEVKRILDDQDNILEHHSNVIEKEDQEDYSHYIKEKVLKLAKDNWDVPIIFTTMVQFLNTFYSKGTRNIRRLHNLAHSVLIFDEVQSVPVNCVSLFNEALNFLKQTCHSSILLCTATQPALDFVKRKLESIDGEVIQNLSRVSEAFKRVEIVDKTRDSGWTTEELSEFVRGNFNESLSILVILNTKTVVRKLFNQFKESHSNLQVYHLSTSMCAAHRKEILKKVKKAIQSRERVLCISTQLIEAGVDISFDCVIRSLAGLDSIAQAAGRCNRHGKLDIRNVYVVNHREENLTRLKEIKVGADITHRILRDRKSREGLKDILSRETMSLYFKNYYTQFDNDLDYPIKALENRKMYDLLNTNKDYVNAYKSKNGKPINLVLNTSIKTASQYFEVIDNQTTSVLVPYGDGEDLIAELNGDIGIRDMTVLLKRAQQYTVNVFQHEINELSKNNNLIYLREGTIICLRENAYDLEFGVSLEGEGTMEGHFI
ncbi:CRISPR-associated helicase Cas3' [Pullulanibacillus sp. KACC 23026]|uniref:CRISPR-associated helicase Cas3' n=1 Tax=Pullulanibacillus sp. KACC 23026 TaxID=3028315 RepID=UPI0023B1B496|nr:CRISPR-associated helicase Cas3' [Pullulanibacillus sp. KACC 23026]WEG12329.1 CRISPR-associated helicase Cas3' [Pullulanibacillus sp. KACC 23026]